MKKQLPLAALVIGITYMFQPFVGWTQERYQELQNFSKVLNLVQQFYVESTDSKKLVYGAIKGMLRELDPHTSYMPPELFKDFESETAGQFGGIGIEISIQNGVLTIISPIEDTPAYKAGIKPGDKVVSINGQSTKGFSLIEASALLKGKNGEPITLTVIREQSDKPLDITIVRGQVKVKSVKTTALDQGYLFIRITSFIETTSDDLKAAIEKFKKDNNGKLEGILIDLRKNPGGLLEQAVQVSDLFLKEGAIVSTMGRDPKSREVSHASRKAPYADIPLVILINEFSASASEIVAGALQDNKRAIIVGERSFGKGSVQSVIKLGDGSGLKLTVARYYTPNGTSIQSEGITPDIEIEDIDADVLTKSLTDKKSLREKDIAGHLKGEKEKAAEKKSGAKAKDTTEETVAWWKDMGSLDGGQLSPKQKLFRSDYQAYQAFSYLKAWKTLKSLKQ